MKKQTSLTGKQIHTLNRVMVYGWIACFLSVCILLSWSLAIDHTWVSTAIFCTVIISSFSAVLAWWYKNSY